MTASVEPPLFALFSFCALSQSNAVSCIIPKCDRRHHPLLMAGIRTPPRLYSAGLVRLRLPVCLWQPRQFHASASALRAGINPAGNRTVLLHKLLALSLAANAEQRCRLFGLRSSVNMLCCEKYLTRRSHLVSLSISALPYPPVR
jgi:hypothetical protein